MKNLQPAMKDSTRYIKFKIHSDKEIEISEMVENFWDASIGYIGVKNLSNANPWLIGNKFDQKNQEGVIRVKKEYVEDIRASLAMISEIGSSKAFISVEKVSGNIANFD